MSDSGPLLAAVDMSDGSLLALDRARSIAGVTGLRLVVATVVEGEPDPATLDTIRSRLEALAPHADVVVRTGRPFIELIGWDAKSMLP